MAVTLPKILVTFTQLATSFIQRSARGIAVLIVRDDTAGTGKTFFQYGDATQVSDTEFTPANQQYIKDARPSAAAGERGEDQDRGRSGGCGGNLHPV